MGVSQLTDRFRVLSKDFQPAYLRLRDSGELKERVERALALLESCTACPRNCRVNRLRDEKRVCQTGRQAMVSSSAMSHLGDHGSDREAVENASIVV